MSRIDFVTGAPEKYAHLVQSLSTASERLRSATANARGSAWTSPPREGGDWTAQHTLAHMALYAQKNGIFIRQMATMTDPARLPFDEDAETAALESRSAADLIALIESELGKTVELLSGTPDAGWGRPGTIRGARRSLRQQVQSHADHMHEHVDQIADALG
ncbi:MAG: DinB family protein [Dehalococcoidia bacterium]|nr:MAG: DinB family protein [Dehalococcoidia bacterium]